METLTKENAPRVDTIKLKCFPFFIARKFNYKKHHFSNDAFVSSYEGPGYRMGLRENNYHLWTVASWKKGGKAMDTILGYEDIKVDRIIFKKRRTMNKNEILKQKIESAENWDKRLLELERLGNKMGEKCGYCNLYRKSAANYHPDCRCSDCPLYPKLCSMKKETPSTYTKIWELMEALQEECSELKDGIEKDIEHTRETLKEEKPLDNLALAVENLIKELGEAFPGIKFILRSKKHEAPWGCAIHVRWIDGPTKKEVKKITDKYERKNHLGGVLPNGVVTYVASRRIHSHKTKTRIGQILCDSFSMKYRGNEGSHVYGQPGCKTIDDYVKKNIRDTSFDSKGNILHIDQDPTYLER